MSTWPAYSWLRDRWGGRGSLAALVLVLALVIALALPVALVAQSLIVHSPAVRSRRCAGFLDTPRQHRASAGLHPDLPYRGPLAQRLLARCCSAAAKSSSPSRKKPRRSREEPCSSRIGGAVGDGPCADPDRALRRLLLLSRRRSRAPPRRRGRWRASPAPITARRSLATAQNAIRGVVYGLIGTAIAQAAVALVGFLHRRGAGRDAARRPHVRALARSHGPGAHLGRCGRLALLRRTRPGWAIFMVIYGAAVISSVDNFVKPILMSRAGNLSMLLVVLGVFGGAIAFGFIGLFVGPALLAVAWNLAQELARRAPRRSRPKHEAAKARIQLSEGMTFVAESGSGHAIVVDASPDVGGRNLGPRPMELVLMGTGACSAIDVDAHPAQGAPGGHRLRGRARCRSRRPRTRRSSRASISTSSSRARASRRRRSSARSSFRRKSIARPPRCSPRPPTVTTDFEIREAAAPQT